MTDGTADPVRRATAGRRASRARGRRFRRNLLNSLTARVVGLSSLWAIAALLAVGVLISALYRQAAEDSFSALLEAQLYNLVNSVDIDDNGTLTGAPNLGDLQYMQPNSGWYWEVIPASSNTRGRLASPSLAFSEIPTVSTGEVPFDLSYKRGYDLAGLAGEELRVTETEVVLDDQNRAARFRVMGNLSELSGDIAVFDQQLTVYLGAVGIGTVLINAAVILFGLRPLKTVERSLARIRDNKAERLEGAFPAEIAPLAFEMNALIDNSRRIVERSRTQVGNLAHSLKTPIAVLLNEADRIGGDHGRLIGEQGSRMREQVQHYLDRARVAAQGEGIVFRTPVAPVLERLVRVVRKLNPDMTIEFDPQTADGLIFAGERQDYEEIIGNLLENAGKWAKGRIVLSCRPETDERFSTTVEDDGCGLTEAERTAALKRGHRLDEQKPGSGLGLSIVSDTAREYNGSLRLERSELGGLAAIVSLPNLRGGNGLT